jgi:hypothetical protein
MKGLMTKEDKREFEFTMMIRDDIEKADGKAADLIFYLRQAHTRACTESPVLAIILRDLIRDVAKIDQRIKEIQGVL